MDDQELHYFKSILGNLREFKSYTSRRIKRGEVSVLGVEVLADNIDWLDCYIDREERKK